MAPPTSANSWSGFRAAASRRPTWVRIIGAGLRGAGHAVEDEAVRMMQAEDGAAGFARIVSELLAATFGAAAKEGQPQNPR
jgi:hypothetical protein